MRTLLFLTAIIGLMQSQAQSYTLDTRLTAFDKEASENYGTDVYIHENTMIIGSPNDGVSNDNDGGSAYIYEWINENWSFVAKIRSNDSIVNFNFGHSVAISDDFAVVSDPSYNFQGAVYIFENNNGSWDQVQKLLDPFPAEFDEYGQSLDLDGDYIFVGSHKDAENASEEDNIPGAGAVFVYHYLDENWDLDSKIVPSDRLEPEASNQQFGYSLAADNGKLIVGAHLRFSEMTATVGAAYIFEMESGEWLENSLIKPADGNAGDNFGWDVDLKGNTAVVGSINHDYDIDNLDFKGESGAAYYLSDSGDDWLIGGKIIWSDRDNGDNFGSSVAITPNEEKIIVGMFEDVNQLEFDGEVYTKSESGAAVVFDRMSDGSYEELERITPSILATGDHFGNSISASNTNIVIGSYLDDIETFPNEGICSLDSIADNGAVDVFLLGESDHVTTIEQGLTLEAYPVPAHDFIDLEANFKIEKIEITNIEGRLIKEFSGKDIERINLSDLGTGVYFIVVNHSQVLRILKE